MIFLFRVLRFTKNFLAHLALVSLILEQFLFVSSASAQTLPITPDGSTNTQVTQTASGVDQVNIAAPNADGLSRNAFTDYNVNYSGQIINNFSGAGAFAGVGANAVVETQIGGLVTTNPNLVNSGSAKVILNEVTSNNVSKLLGYTEIAGSKADLILANPNGIACAGCGFINSAKLLMVAGSSNFDSNDNLGFNLKEQANPNLYVPLITIDGLGLDVSLTSSTDIIASSIRLISSIYGSDNTALTLKTGEGRYDYSTKEIAGSNVQNNSEAVFAIDASNLAKIQSGQVFLIATKQGVGVKMEAEILASQSVNIDANGNIYYAKISSGDKASIKSSKSVESIDANSKISSPNLRIQANEFKNLGNILAYNLGILNSNRLANLGKIEALTLDLSNITDINNSGSLYGESSLNISGNNLSNNSSGSIFSPQSYAITLTGLLTNSGVISSGSDLGVTANQLSNSSEVSAQNNLTFSIADLVTNSGNLISGKKFSFTANSFSNSGTTQSEDDSSFNLESLINSEKASIYSAKNLSLNVSESLINSGEISSLGNFEITGTSSIANTNKILSNGDLSIAGSELTNSPSGVIASLAKSLTLALSGNLQNDGEFDSVTDLTASAVNFANSGNILGGANLVLSLANFTNLGNLQSTNNTNITTSSLDNSGLIKSLAKATINADVITNQATALIFTNDDLTLTASVGGLNNSGEISSQNNFTINSQNIFSNSGAILATQNLNLSADSLSNDGEISASNNLNIITTFDIANSSKILANGTLNIAANNLTNKNSAAIASLADSLTLTLANNLQNSGEFKAATNLTTNSKNFTNSGNVLSANNLTLTTTNSLTNSGNLQSTKDFSLTAASLDNSGGIKSFKNSTINTNSIINRADALIFSASDATINASSFTNSGSILSAAKFDLAIGQVSNDGEIFSSGDLNFVLTDSLNNSGGISSLANINLLSTSSITNSSEILSGGNLTIAATNLTNSDKIQSDKNLTLNLQNLTNDKNISSTGIVTINTAGNVVNNSTIQSADNFTINAGSFTNSASSLILAGKDLNIKSATITNANTKPSSSSITSGLVSVNGNIIIQADSLNNNSGIIAARSTTLNALNNSSVALSNALGSFVSTASISLNLGNINYTITGEVTAGNVDITANNITNLGNVTANDFIKLNATGSSATGNGNITNGQAGANNGNVKLSAGSYLTATANRFITNYGTLSSNNDLTLTSNYSEIHNYGSITGGDGITTVNATNADNGNFNNYVGAKLTANNNLFINVKDLNNYGEISVRNDLTTNISNNLNNKESALIWSGRDSTFNVANNFINNRADIYSDRNLTIQKNSSGEKTGLVQNVSGSIETYSGNGIIKAITLENKRSSMKTQGADFVYGSKVVGGGTKHCKRFRGCRQDPYIYANLWGADVYGTASAQSSITSGNLLTIDVSNTFLNDTSTISSRGNMAINANVFNNISRSFRSYRQDQYDNTETFLATIKSGGSMSGTVASKINNSTIASNTTAGSAAYKARGTTINKVDNYTIQQTGVLNLDLSSIVSAINSGNVASNGSELNLSKNNSLGAVTTKDLTKNNITNLLENSGSNNLVVSSAELNINSSTLGATNSETIFSGSFKISINGSPNKPLVESRSQFTDVTKFFGSRYYFAHLGIDLDEMLRNIAIKAQEEDLKKRQIQNGIDNQARQIIAPTKLLGDAFVESRLIIDQLKNLTSDSLFLSKNTSGSDQQIKSLLDNSIAELNRLGLNATDIATKGLTKDQINSLGKDIITFETTSVNGISVLAPKIYLSLDTRNRLLGSDGSLAKNSVIFAKDKLTVDSPFADLTNNGTIVSGGDLTLNLASLTNKTNLLSQAQIESNNDLSITAVDDIKNIGSSIISNNNISLISTKGNILSTAIVQTNDINLLNSKPDSYQLARMDSARSGGNITSTLLSSASIKGKDISISASNDFTNLAANIEATNLKITAGDDVNIGNLALRNRIEASWGGKKKGGTSISDITTNIGSDINSSGSIAFITNGSSVDSGISGTLQGSNIQITSSNLTATDNITIAAKDDVVIQAAQNTSYQESQSWKKGATVAKNSISGSDSTTNVISTLTSTSGNILLTSGSDTNIIGAKLKADDVAINAGDEINVYSVSDKNSSWASSSKSRNLSAITKPLVALAVVSPMVTLGGALATAVVADAANHSSKSLSNSKEKTSNLSSVIEATGDVVLASNQDLTISGSDVSGKAGNLTSDQGDVNILSAIETEKTSSSSKSASRETHVPGLKGSKKSSDGVSETITNIASNLTFTDSLTINTNGDSLNPDQKSDINIKGSNITVSGGDLTLASAGNITVENAVDSTLNESSSKKRNENVKSISQATDYVERAVSSNLDANNINIQSRGDTTIQGSDINAKENLLVGSFAIAQDESGNYKKDDSGNYLTTANTTVDNLIIKNADLQEYHYAQSGKGYVGVAGAAMQAAPYVLGAVQIVVAPIRLVGKVFLPDEVENGLMKYTLEGQVLTLLDKTQADVSSAKISETTETKTDKSTSFASNINVGGSMMTNSIGDTTIQGSNVNVGGNLLANSIGDFTISAAQNTESTTAKTSFETAGKFHSDFNLSHVNYKAGIEKEFVEQGNESTSATLTSSNVNIGGSTLINSSEGFALAASNLISNGSIEINSKNNLNISDGKNTQSTSSYSDKLTIDTGVKVGNAYVDTAYAVVDAVEAQKKVKDSYDKLQKIEDLHDQDMASSKAVERAKYQVVLALVNAGLSTAAAMQAVGNAGVAASTSLGTGFYGSVYTDITKLKSTTTSEYAQSIASNLVSGDNLSLTSGVEDINITGSNVSSTNGDLNLTAMLGNLNVKAGESTYSQSSKMRSQNLGGSVGNNGFSANIGFNEAESSFDQTTFTNSQLTAEKGTLNINTKQDANITGANLLAKDINLDIGGNLLVKSKQNLAESDSYSIGMSLGISGDSSGANGGSVGFNLGNGYSNRAWVDQVTSIVGTNSVTINTANDTNIIGAMIANKDANGNDLGNLALNTKSLTYSDLKNFSVSESNNLGINLSAGKNPNNPTANGSLALSLAMNGNESSSDTKATIGKGSININSTTTNETQLAGLNRDIAQVEANKRDMITSDFNADLKIDLRLLAAAGNLAVGNTDKAAANWNSYAQETTRGANITYDALAIPLTSLGKTVVGDVNASDALLATGKNYQNLYQLAYNPNIVVTDLAGEGKLLTYNGDQLDQTAHARYAEGFYDRNSDTAAINVDSNRTDSQLAGTAAHEGGHRLFNKGGHRLFNNNGQSYTSSEENSAHMIGDFAQSRWNTYKADNTSFRASVPNSTLNFNNNFYANNVKFGNDVNPLIDTVWDAANVALGGTSLYKNLQDKNYKDAAVDGVGLVVDTVSLVTPFVPGGASTAIKGVRAGEKVVDGTKSVEKVDNIGEGSTAIVTSGKGNKGPDFYVSPKGEVMPATAYRYTDSGSPAAKRALETGSSDLDSYFGFEKIDSSAKVQDRYQILPQWSNTKVRSEFDTLQLFDKNGNLNAEVPFSQGGSGAIPEPFANSYPKDTHGQGGGQQLVPKNPQQIKLNNSEVLND